MIQILPIWVFLQLRKVMDKTKVIIIGGKGTAVNIAEGIYDAERRYGENIECLGFALDDRNFGDSINGFPILCKTYEAFDKYGNYGDVKFIFQMNNQNKMKERGELVKSYDIPPEKWFTFIHPSAFVAKSAKIGHGSVIFAHCAIHSNTIIGNHCTLSALTTVGHDTIIGDHVFMATHVCIGSSVSMGDYLFFGQNTTVTGSINIKGNNLIGLGACVLQDIKDSNKVFVGIPAKSSRSIN